MNKVEISCVFTNIQAKKNAWEIWYTDYHVVMTKKGEGGTFDIKFTKKSSKNLLNSSICKKYRIYGKFNKFSKKIESGGHLLIYRYKCKVTAFTIPSSKIFPGIQKYISSFKNNSKKKWFKKKRGCFVQNYRKDSSYSSKKVGHLNTRLIGSHRTVRRILGTIKVSFRRASWDN